MKFGENTQLVEEVMDFIRNNKMKVSTLESMQIDIANGINDFQYEVNKLIELIKLEFGDFNSTILSQKNIIDENLLKMIANISKDD